jgi:hypothetical protein
MVSLRRAAPKLDDSQTRSKGQAGEEFLYDTLKKRPLGRSAEKRSCPGDYDGSYQYLVD